MLHYNTTGDFTSILLISVNVGNSLLVAHPIANAWLQTISLIIGILAGLVLIIDHCLKIHWKLKQRQKDRDEKDN